MFLPFLRAVLCVSLGGGASFGLACRGVWLGVVSPPELRVSGMDGVLSLEHLQDTPGEGQPNPLARFLLSAGPQVPF